MLKVEGHVEAELDKSERQVVEYKKVKYVNSWSVCIADIQIHFDLFLVFLYQTWDSLNIGDINPPYIPSFTIKYFSAAIRAANSLGTWEPGSHEIYKLKRIFW